MFSVCIIYMLKDGWQFLMYSHTALRNLGLFTSLAIAATTGALSFKPVRPKATVHVGHLILYGLAVLLLVVAVRLNLAIQNNFDAQRYGEIQASKEHDQESSKGLKFDHLRFIPRMVLAVQAALALVLAYGLMSKLRALGISYGKK